MLATIRHLRRQIMASKALLVRLEAKPGQEDAVREFLLSALPLVEQEPGTAPWFAVRFGPSTYSSRHPRSANSTCSQTNSERRRLRTLTEVARHAEVRSTMSTLTLADARKIIAAAERRATELDQPQNIAVVDAGGNLIAHVRM